MNILIVGLGEVGSHLAKVLSTEGHAVTIVDPDLHKLQRVADLLDVQSVHGDGSRPDVLDRAEAHRADLLLAVSNDDKVNMLTCLFGKRIGAKKTVLRLKDTAALQRSKTFFKKNLLYDLLLSLDDLASEELIGCIRLNRAIGVDHFADGRVQMRRFKIDESSNFVGVAFKDLKITKAVLITAIDRDHEVIVPGGEDVFAVGDEIFVLGEPKDIAAFEKKTGAKPHYLKNLVVYGSSGVAVKVCKAMQADHVAVRVIVDDREEAERLSEVLEGVTVLHAEATDLNFLQEERIGDSNVFVGASEEDELNLMSCQLARNLGVGRTFALVQKPDYAELYQQLGVDRAISPRTLCSDSILSFVRGGSVSAIATFEEGKASTVEVVVRPGSRLVGVSLKAAGFPRGSVVCAIMREDGEVLLPTGEDEFQANDRLVIFCLERVAEEVNRLVEIDVE